MVQLSALMRVKRGGRRNAAYFESQPSTSACAGPSQDRNNNGVSNMKTPEPLKKTISSSSSKRREPYQMEEDLLIIQYIETNEVYNLINGRKLWQDMENHLGYRRTWQSLKERFMMRISPNIEKYRQFGVKDSTVAQVLTRVVKLELKTEKRERRNYTFDDDVRILKFIIQTGRYREVGGVQLWQEMASRNKALSTHTWQSLKNRFNKTILPKLTSYGLTPEEGLRFRRKKKEIKTTHRSSLGSPAWKRKRRGVEEVVWHEKKKKDTHFYSFSSDSSPAQRRKRVHEEVCYSRKRRRTGSCSPPSVSGKSKVEWKRDRRQQATHDNKDDTVTLKTSSRWLTLCQQPDDQEDGLRTIKKQSQKKYLMPLNTVFLSPKTPFRKNPRNSSKKSDTKQSPSNFLKGQNRSSMQIIKQREESEEREEELGGEEGSDVQVIQRGNEEEEGGKHSEKDSSTAQTLAQPQARLQHTESHEEKEEDGSRTKQRMTTKNFLSRKTKRKYLEAKEGDASEEVDHMVKVKQNICVQNTEEEKVVIEEEDQQEESMRKTNGKYIEDAEKEEEEGEEMVMNSVDEDDSPPYIDVMCRESERISRIVKDVRVCLVRLNTPDPDLNTAHIPHHHRHNRDSTSPILSILPDHLQPSTGSSIKSQEYFTAEEELSEGSSKTQAEPSRCTPRTGVRKMVMRR